ncbi:uncharacterized protein LOC131938192 [Physella acuta]|uniref:uncharacterized protein LOC131938192 n=1 Tax=Physella acuta TaxID=109671 RepID=UPI0027DD29B4|nr:uncharacterized protein LOC131938192 [Physella acuta]
MIQCSISTRVRDDPMFHIHTNRLNSVFWKDEDGRFYKAQLMDLEIKSCDVLAAFRFDQPELIITMFGTVGDTETRTHDPDLTSADKTEKSTHADKGHGASEGQGYTESQKNDLTYRNIPTEAVSYAGWGGVHMLQPALRRRFIQLLHEIGAWMLSEHSGKFILESSNQPFPDDITENYNHFEEDKFFWPPDITYSSVWFQGRGMKSIVNDLRCTECVFIARGDDKTLEKIDEYIKNTTKHMLIIKGSGGLADVLAFLIEENVENMEAQEIFSYINSNLKDGEEMEGQESLSPPSSNGNKDTTSQTRKKFAETVKRICKQCTVFEPDLSLPDYGLSKSILQICFKNSGKRNPEILKLCVDLNCLEEAEKQIFLPDYKGEDCVFVLRTAFSRGKVDFIKAFLMNGDFKAISNEEFVKMNIMSDSRDMHFDKTYTGILWNAEALSNTDTCNIMDHLFRQALVLKKFEMSFLFWIKTSSPLAHALLAYRYLTKISEPVRNIVQKKEIEDAAYKYQDMAVELINACYVENPDLTANILAHKRKMLFNNSCIEYALISRNGKFLMQPACTNQQKRYWDWGIYWEFYDEISNDYRNVETIVAEKPVVTGKPDSSEKSPKGEQVLIREKSSVPDNKKHLEKSESSHIEWHNDSLKGVMKNIHKYYVLLCPPKVMFSLNGIGLLIFLYIFGQLLLGQLSRTKITWSEYYLLVYVVLELMEELYELFFLNQRIGKDLPPSEMTLRKRMWRRLSNYLTSGWNVVDYLSIFLFVIGGCLRMYAYFQSAETEIYEYARVALCLDFIVFTVRMLHNCYASSYLGPTFVMILEIVTELVQFLYILAVVWISYTITSEAILYPNSQLNRYMIFYLLRKAYWQMFGELFLDEIEAEESGEGLSDLECTTDPNLYYTYRKLRCPSTIGRYIAPVMLGIYIMLTNVLLFNVITANFTKGIERIQAESNLIWRLQVLDLTINYSQVLLLPPPFTFMSIFARVFEKSCGLNLFPEYTNSRMRARMNDLEHLVIQKKIEPLILNPNDQTGPKDNVNENLSKSTLSSRSQGLNKNKWSSIEGYTCNLWIPLYKHIPISKTIQVTTETRLDPEPDKQNPYLLKKASLKFNEYDKYYKTDRRSYMGKYDVVDGYPIIPVRNQGYVSFKKNFSRWGPNHFGIPIITRFKIVNSHITVIDDAFDLEFLVENIKEDSKDGIVVRFPMIECDTRNDPFEKLLYDQIKQKDQRKSRWNYLKTKFWLRLLLSRSKTTNTEAKVEPGKDWPNPFTQLKNQDKKSQNATQKTKFQNNKISDKHDRLPDALENENPANQKIPEKEGPADKTLEKDSLPEDAAKTPDENLVERKMMRNYQKRDQVYIGFHSDKRTTRNSWAEVRVINYHNPTQANVNLLCKNAKFSWISADEYLKLEKRDQEYLELVCNIRNAWSPKKYEYRAKSAKSAKSAAR